VHTLLIATLVLNPGTRPVPVLLAVCFLGKHGRVCVSASACIITTQHIHAAFRFSPCYI
jgi:hypothetical protein